MSEPEISSSFAASLESGQVSDAEEPVTSGLSSPTSADDFLGFHRRQTTTTGPNILASRPVSPGRAIRSITSSYSSSLESLHSHHSGRLLTIHLEKEQSIIWPSLIVGPVPETLSPLVTNPIVYNSSQELEHQYNMDPTSLVLLALEMFDIRKDKEEAFEFFL